MNLSGEVALVTGGRGIGFSTAKIFSEFGAHVIITSKDSRLENSGKNLSNTIGLTGDIRNENDVRKVVEQTLK